MSLAPTHRAPLAAPPAAADKGRSTKRRKPLNQRGSKSRWFYPIAQVSIYDSVYNSRTRVKPTGQFIVTRSRAQIIRSSSEPWPDRVIDAFAPGWETFEELVGGSHAEITRHCCSRPRGVIAGVLLRTLVGSEGRSRSAGASRSQRRSRSAGATGLKGRSGDSGPTRPLRGQREIQGRPGLREPKAIKAFLARKARKVRKETKARPAHRDNKGRRAKRAQTVQKERQALQARPDPKEIKAKRARRARREKRGLSGLRVLRARRTRRHQQAFTSSGRIAVAATAPSPAALVKLWHQ